MQPRELIVYESDSEPAPPTAAALREQFLREQQGKLEARSKRFGPVSPPHPTSNEPKLLGTKRGVVSEEVYSVGAHADEFEQRRAARRKRFGEVMKKKSAAFGAGKPVARVKTLEERRNMPIGERVREEVVHVFGVDALSTRDLIRYFKKWGFCRLEWLNDSSCNVVFKNRLAARRAFQVVGVEAEVGWSGEEEVQWWGGGKVEKRNGMVPIWIRMAGVGDVRPELANPASRWRRKDREMRVRGKRVREVEVEKKVRFTTGGPLGTGEEEMKKMAGRKKRFAMGAMENTGGEVYEEDEKRKKRVKRFGMSLKNETAGRDENVKKRVERKKRFGTEGVEGNEGGSFVGEEESKKRAERRNRFGAGIVGQGKDERGNVEAKGGVEKPKLKMGSVKC